MNPLSKLKSTFSRLRRGFTFNRPLVLLQSDDWGRVGVRDGEGWELLRLNGLDLGSHPYDFYSLETASDVAALRAMLGGHRDSTGRSACVVMNFVTANIDFYKATPGCREIPLRPLSSGLPGSWKRPGLFEELRAGIADGVLYPALHGLTHFCNPTMLASLRNDSRAKLLQKLWTAETPYIYWRMPWVGYEYCSADGRFLQREQQRAAIEEAAGDFCKTFGFRPFSACAPGYRANSDTHAAWRQAGIRVAQNGPGCPLLPHFDEYEILHLYRVIDFEPSHSIIDVHQLLRAASDCFQRGAPLIISVHSINFHSSLKDFRSLTLKSLDACLSALERNYPDLLYVHDRDLYDIATSGRYRSRNSDQAVVSNYAYGDSLHPAGAH